MDLNTIKGNFELMEVYELIGTYEFYFDEDSPRIKIKIMKDQDGNFWVFSDHTINGYRSLYPKDNPKDALRDAINGLKLFYNRNSKSKWEKVEDE